MKRRKQPKQQRKALIIDSSLRLFSSFTHDIAQLEQELDRLAHEREARIACRMLNNQLKRRKILNLKLAYLHSFEQTVSDHAVVRYLEHVLGYDVEAIRANIYDNNLKTLVSNLGPNGKYPSASGKLTLVVRNGIVVTLYPIDKNLP